MYKRQGFIFKSSTDTEVLVQLIEFFQLSNLLDLLTAVQLALHEVIGAYAIAVLDKNNPDEIIAARKMCIRDSIRPVHDSAGNEHRSRQGGSQRRS